MSERGDGHSKRTAIVTIALVGVVFLLPLVAAYLWHPSGDTVNYGTLIQPARPLKDFEMVDLEGNAAGLKALNGKWTLLYVGGEHCREQCRHNLYKIERVRLAQGKNMQRVQSLYMVPSTVESGTVADTLVQYRGLQGYRISRDELGVMAPGFDLGRQSSTGADERIYVVDPLGNLMMFYSADADPTGMKKDLERLLKVSQIG